MNKQAIVAALQQNHSRFSQYILSLSDTECTSGPAGKWTPLQQLDHLCSSVNAVNLAFKLPVFLVKWRFGKANRPSKTYDELVAKYQAKLQGGVNPPARFQPAQINIGQKKMLLAKLDKVVKTMCNGVEKMSETNLDLLILPHPLMGRITLREMMYFTIYHAEHHENLVRKYAK